MRKNHVIRVEMEDVPQPVDKLLEQFRYMGVIGQKKGAGFTLQFDIPAPRGVDAEQWAKMNAERMRTFGYRATAIKE